MYQQMVYANRTEPRKVVNPQIFSCGCDLAYLLTLAASGQASGQVPAAPGQVSTPGLSQSYHSQAGPMQSPVNGAFPSLSPFASLQPIGTPLALPPPANFNPFSPPWLPLASPFPSPLSLGHLSQLSPSAPSSGAQPVLPVHAMGSLPQALPVNLSSQSSSQLQSSLGHLHSSLPSAQSAFIAPVVRGKKADQKRDPRVPERAHQDGYVKFVQSKPLHAALFVHCRKESTHVHKSQRQKSALFCTASGCRFIQIEARWEQAEVHAKSKHSVANAHSTRKRSRSDASLDTSAFPGSQRHGVTNRQPLPAASESKPEKTRRKIDSLAQSLPLGTVPADFINGLVIGPFEPAPITETTGLAMESDPAHSDTELGPEETLILESTTPTSTRTRLPAPVEFPGDRIIQVAVVFWCLCIDPSFRLPHLKW